MERERGDVMRAPPEDERIGRKDSDSDGEREFVEVIRREDHRHWLGRNRKRGNDRMKIDGRDKMNNHLETGAVRIA